MCISIADDLFLLETIPLQVCFGTTTLSKLPSEGVEQRCLLGLDGKGPVLDASQRFQYIHIIRKLLDIWHWHCQSTIRLQGRASATSTTRSKLPLDGIERSGILVFKGSD